MEPGTLLANRYRIEAFLADGDASRVYDATDVEATAPVAVKVMAATPARRGVLARRRVPIRLSSDGFMEFFPVQMGWVWSRAGTGTKCYRWVQGAAPCPRSPWTEVTVRCQDGMGL